MTLKQQLRTVLVFTKLNTRRFYRDKVALFFGIGLPLVFLLVFGLLNSGGNNATFNVAVINQSSNALSREYVDQLGASKSFEIDKKLTNYSQAKDKLSKSQLDGIIVLPKSFGAVKNGKPSGQAEVVFAKTSTGTGETLTTVVNGTLQGINNKLGVAQPPFAAKATELNERSLSSFDYTFAGLLGFSIVGLGIFGPMSVFPELKKQGILRRLHTTPLRVWQYFTATMFSQALIGISAVAIQFAVALLVFDLTVVGNYAEIMLFTVFSIGMILGIGLAIGGWAKNERQAAPVGNAIVFPLLFLSGAFFPRFLMPPWVQDITAYLPLTPVIDGLRFMITEGKHLIDLGPQLGLITLWLIIIYALAFRVFKWE